jgi:chromosome segregation ATPase
MELNNFSTINLSQKEIKDIQQFCELNKIEDIPSFLHTCAWKGYEVEKYGLLGKMGGIQEKRVEIEVIREKRVEIPVEVIKEVVKVEYVEVPVEVIKEVQVEKVVIKEVVKEVPVETVVTKVEYISDKTGENELLLKIQQLESEKQEFSTKLTETEQKLQLFSTKTTEMENIFQDEKNELLLKMKQLENQPEKMITDNSKQKALEETIQKIRTELQLKNKEINDLKLTISDIQKQGGSKSVYMDGSNLGKILR